MTKRITIEFKGWNAKTQRIHMKAKSEAEAYKTVLEDSITRYEKLLLKYAPDWKQQHTAEMERLLSERVTPPDGEANG